MIRKIDTLCKAVVLKLFHFKAPFPKIKAYNLKLKIELNQ